MAVHYLEMTSVDDVVPSREVTALIIEAVDPPNGEINQRFYRDVGASWQWTDRAPWSVENWKDYVDDEALKTWLFKIDGVAIGYGETRNEAGDVEVVYFGLLPAYVGCGYGGAALTMLLQAAWSQLGARRVWLHTCDEDHPNALRNYQRRGLRHYDTRDE